MARRTTGLGNSKSVGKVGRVLRQESLDYHEGISANQAKIILREFGFNDKSVRDFNEWMYGQTCPVLVRHNRESGKEERVGGIYEYDLFRWIENQKRGTPLVWD